jgi:hypothetical protein
VTHAPLITTAAADTAVTTTSNSAEASADIHTVNLLGGLIVANEVVAVSTTTQGGSGLHVSAAGTMFSDLAVLGLPIASNVAPNTTITLPGIGKVILNEQLQVVGTSQANLTIHMVHVYVTLANALGFAVGTQIIIGAAVSSLTIPNGAGSFRGYSFGTEINGGLVQSSRTAYAALACAGTSGLPVTVNAASLNLPSILNTGTVADTIKGSITPTVIFGQTSSTIQTLSLLGGAITFQALKVQANASSSDGGAHVSLNDSGTAFTHLVVLGHPEIVDTVPAFTKVSLAGIGTLYLHWKTTTANNINVIGIAIAISATNTLGLPAQNVYVGVANIGIVP